MAISNEIREEFMQSIYDMLSDDGNNDRANQIIDMFDIATENCIELPCQVGGTLYDIYGLDYKIECIVISDKILIWCRHLGNSPMCFNIAQIGKTVFLTKEASDKAWMEI